MYAPFQKLAKKASLQSRSVGSHPIDSIDDLRDHLQTAVELEFSTLPPYLTALYSITDNSSYAYQLIRSVALEEMLHFNLAANMLLSVGGTPKITGDNCPQYPAQLPRQNTNGPMGQLIIQLMPLSKELLKNVFMAIEEPSPALAPPQSTDYDTIGQFYKAIAEGFKHLSKELGPDLFANDSSAFQKTNYYFGSGGGQVIKITNLETALKAIEIIADQGEGNIEPGKPFVPTQAHGNFDNYGYRTDGTYGPMVDSTVDHSHYFKFRDLANEVYPIPGSYPMVANPKVAAFGNEYAKAFGKLFNQCYSLMMKALERAFGSNDQPDPFMTVGFPLMQAALPLLSKQLMSLPVSDIPVGQETFGPVAGPSFEYVATSLKETLDFAQHITDWVTKELREKPSKTGQASAISGMVDTASSIVDTLTDIQHKAASLSL